MNKKTLVIIAGARRGIGRPFFDYFKKRKNTVCIGFARTKTDQLVQLNLLDQKGVLSFVNKINFSKFNRIIYMHCVGKDKFEPEGKPHIDKNGDGIDDEIYAGNVTAFMNFILPLRESVLKNKISLKVVNIGSVSDVVEVPFWQSFTRAKNIIRGYMKSISSSLVQSLFLNVSTTIDYDDFDYKWGRPYADTTYWQTSMELFDKSIRYVEARIASNYVEMDFYKYNPNFREDYFINLDELYKQYQKDMGYVGKKIPPGISI